MKTMRAKELLRYIAKETGYRSSYVAWIIGLLIDVIKKTDRVEIRGLGVFEWVKRPTKSGSTEDVTDREFLRFTPTRRLSRDRGV